jgi:adenine-specific DNA-methyltransferase
MTLTNYHAKYFAHEPTKRCASDSMEKLAGQKRIKALESQRNEKRRWLFVAQDEVDQQREDLIANIEGKLTQRSGLQRLFTIRWKLA